MPRIVIGITEGELDRSEEGKIITLAASAIAFMATIGNGDPTIALDVLHAVTVSAYGRLGKDAKEKLDAIASEMIDSTVNQKAFVSVARFKTEARRPVDDCRAAARTASMAGPLLRSRAGSRRQALWEIVNAAGPDGMMKAEIIDACRDAIDSTPSSIATMLTLLRRQGRMERFDGGIWRATTFRTEQVMLRRKGVNP